MHARMSGRKRKWNDEELYISVLVDAWGAGRGNPGGDEPD